MKMLATIVLVVAIFVVSHALVDSAVAAALLGLGLCVVAGLLAGLVVKP